uniref:Hemolymph proteinase 13 n=1 Tax=Manduca sexta TaxID=7130 RepID=Q5MPC1_MANSE|nr:hemolymph proteinase 13 [Manduca sexta]
MYRGALVSLALCVIVKAQFEGEPCIDNDLVGVCTAVDNCISAREGIRNRIQPKLCSFDREIAIVCCLDNLPTTTTAPVATTHKPVTTTPDDFEPPPEEYEVVGGKTDTCGPVDANLTSPRTGQLAWDKCLEYQEKLVYPCEDSVSLRFGAGKERKNKCHLSADSLIVGGKDADRNEFTHMVLLGFGEDPRKVKWDCAGSLISEYFVLTAAHCVTSADSGNVTYASVGVLTRSEVAPDNTYKISERFRHPSFRRGVYNDIALLRLEREVLLGEYRVPACLHVGDTVKDARAMATGWGLLEYRGNVSDILQKVTLKKYRSRICKAIFPPHTLVSHNYDEKTQLCFGGYNDTQPGDTCNGDSGGPLMIKHKKINCMYLILGVTSGGRGCAWRGKPGLYSRVSHYISWIESVVWR